MKKLKRQIHRYFNYTRNERIAVFSLGMYCLTMFFLPKIYQNFQPARTTDFTKLQAEIASFRASQPQFFLENDTSNLEKLPTLFAFDPNLATFDDFVKLGLSKKISNTILNYRDRGGKFFKPEDFRKIYGLAEADFLRLEDFIKIEGSENQWKNEKSLPVATKFENFKFNPNTASEHDFQRLGLPQFLAARIVKYRNAGGIFRKKEDLKKIYGFPEKDFLRLENYIQIVENEPIAAAPRPVTYASTASNFPQKKDKNTRLDINKATAEDFEKLPGIGIFRAEKMVYFREKLGGFSSVEQVAESRGLPDSVFQNIKNSLFFEAPVFKKINLNTATLEELNAHPYLDKRNAQLILAYRSQHGNYKNSEEIRKIGAFKDEGWLKKVLPYLSAD